MTFRKTDLSIHANKPIYIINQSISNVNDFWIKE